MRGAARERFETAGKILALVVLATTAMAAIAAGRLGWTNYWGGFVYAPIALALALFGVVVVIKQRRDRQRRKRKRR